jgi:hypothetical protein
MHPQPAPPPWNVAVPADTAGTIACARCGGRFGGFALAPVVPCPYCHHAHALRPDELATLSRYRDQVARRYAAADDHATQLAAWQKWYGADGKSTWSAGRFFAIAGAFAALAGLIGAGLAAAGVIVWEMLPGVVVMGGFLPATLVMYGLMLARMFRGQEGARVARPDVAVACPSCGAPQAIAPGSELSHCAFCKAPLLPTRTIMDRGLSAADAARRSAALARYRTERSAMANVYARSASSYAVYLAFGPFSLMLTVPAIMFTAEVVRGETDARPEGLVVLWLLVFVLWAVLGGVYVLRRSMRRRTDGALDDLARRFGGRRLAGIREVVDWLNRLWAGRRSRASIGKGGMGWVITRGTEATRSAGRYCTPRYR